MSKQDLKLMISLSRTFNSMIFAVEKSLKPYGLTISEFGVLEYLYHKGEQPVQRIAEKILVTSGTITYVIDKLQKKGYAARKQCDHDKRVYYVQLTAEGEALIVDAFREHEQFLDRLFKGVNADEKRVLIKKLIELQASIGAIDEEGGK